MFRILFTILALIGLTFSCKQDKPREFRGSWHYTRSFPLNNVNPISISGDNYHLFISSGLKTEVHRMNYDGGLIEQIKNLRKPKYLNVLSQDLFAVAESEAHVASSVRGQQGIVTIPTNIHLDNPFGVDVEGNNIAITDIGKQMIYYNKGGQILPFGTAGKADGQFDGPTDVQIYKDNIYVSDSKNNRVQVFDIDGKHISTIGEKDGIKTTGGLYITEQEITVTDYNGHRILVYDQKGNLLQSITGNLNNPSDVFIRGIELFAVNYGDNTVSVFKRW